MILKTKKDFENALLKGEEIKHQTVFYTGDWETQERKIGDYDSKYGVFCGVFRGKKIWCDLHDAAKQMDWQDALDYCQKQGGVLPDIDVLTWVYLNKDEINKGLEANGGDAFAEDNYYWSSSEAYSNHSWRLSMNNGYRSNNNKYNTYYVRSFQLL